MRRPGTDAGFTLVESLAALVIVGLLGLLISVGASRAAMWAMRPDPASRWTSIEAAQDFLRGRLERGFPYVGVLTSPPQIDFDGLADKADFVAPAAAAKGPDALWRYHLALDPNGDLVLYGRNDLAIDQQRYSDRQVLMRGVGALSLAYFGPAPPDGSAGWRDRWSGQPTLPWLVRVRVDFPPGDPRRWPDLIVRPAAQLDSACVVDPSTGDCRGGS